MRSRQCWIWLCTLATGRCPSRMSPNVRASPRRTSSNCSAASSSTALVIGARGPGGGYRLARTLDETSVSDIISAVGEGVDATRCGGTGDCQDGETCLTHELWADLSQQIDLFLKRITFATLVERRDIRSIARRQDPKNLINAQIL